MSDEIGIPNSKTAERYQNFSIELDCEPGPLRPNHLISAVLKDCGLTELDFETSPPFFGHQIWTLKAGDLNKDKLFSDSKSLFKERIEKLYNGGHIRYGSW